MSFYWFDLLQLSLFVGGCFCVYKLKGKKRFIPLALFTLSFLFSPVNLTDKNTTKRFVSGTIVPDKVAVEKESFIEKQDAKYKKLKEESKEKFDEIN